MRIPTYYDERYAPTEEPLLARLGVTHARLQRLKLIHTMPVTPITAAQLHGLHDEKYLQAFMRGEEPLASTQGLRWQPYIRDATLAMLGGQLQAAKALFDTENIALNIARGFHHAHPIAGSGFCPINGLALIAHTWPDKQIAVIDCDEHGGNGTEEFAALMPNLYNISIFGTRFGCFGGKRSWAFHIQKRGDFKAYKQALLATHHLLEEIQPDLVVYQAGADCHEHDPKSQLGLTRQEIFRRDLLVLEMSKRLRLPVLIVVAGGYQAAENVAAINANTVRAARYVWQNGIQ